MNGSLQWILINTLWTVQLYKLRRSQVFFRLPLLSAIATLRRNAARLFTGILDQFIYNTVDGPGSFDKSSRPLYRIVVKIRKKATVVTGNVRLKGAGATRQSQRRSLHGKWWPGV